MVTSVTRGCWLRPQLASFRNAASGFKPALRSGWTHFTQLQALTRFCSWRESFESVSSAFGNRKKHFQPVSVGHMARKSWNVGRELRSQSRASCGGFLLLFTALVLHGSSAGAGEASQEECGVELPLLRLPCAACPFQDSSHSLHGD